MKKALSLILVLVMLLGMMPMTAIAAGTTFSKESIGALSASQDAAIFDGKIFVPNTSGNCAVYNLSTRAKIDDFAFAKFRTITPHGNTICFGNTYYQDGDKYPLLYVPLWNKSNSTKGTCCVYRIMEDASGKFSSSLVQVIKIGFVDDGTLWSPSTSTRPYGTFVVDNDNSKLYVAVTRDADSKTRYFEFAIPAITAGTVNDEYGCNVVTLEEEDILRRFDSDFTNYQQGITYHDGKIYASAGFVSSGVPAALYIIDLATGDTTDAYVLGDYGLSAQPCWISEDPDTGKIYYGNNDNVMYLLSFKEPDPGHEHSYTSEIIPPTCEKEGYTLYTCACGHSYKDTYTEAGHNYVAGVCSVCDDSVLGTDWIAPDFAEGDYSMVAIPDPQRLVQLWPNKYYALAQWIADNKTALNIQAVMYMGDMVHNKDGTDLDELYPISKNATAILDNTGIPWMPMMGNHDPSNKFNSYYDYATYGSGRSWFGGSYHDDQLDHTYWYVTVGEREYMILSLGYNPGNSVLAWAQDVVEDNQDKNVIITTHSCINRDGSFLSEGTRIWNALSSYENVVLSLCGHLHSPDIVTRTDKNGADKDVTTFLLDRQDDDAENHYAMIALFTFDEDSDTVSVNWYSTYYDALYKSANQFTFNVPHIEVEEECEHSYETVVTPPTCTEQGYTTYTCECGDSYVDDYVDATGHTYQNGICTGCGANQPGPVITQQPESVQQEIGKKFAITVKAEGDGLTYQWYVKEAGAKAFKVSVNKTASYAYTMQDYMHNRQVYCVVTDANGNSVQTETATITRPPQALRIVEQPQDARVNVGEKFSISPKVEGEGLSYQWYVKESGAKTFKVSSIKGSAYALTMQKYMIGRQVYCVITDKYGNSVTTDVATISLPPVELKILQQPSDVYASKGEKFSISFVVQGDGLTYQWYYKESYMKDFKPSSNKTSAYAYSMQTYMNERSVYCVITDKYGNQVQTEVVTIYLGNLITK